MPWVALAFLMSHMSINHVHRHFINDPSKIDVTGAQMVLVMKLSAFCWNVHDGRTPSTTLSSFQNQRQITQMPSLQDFAGYVFFFPALFAGPAFDYIEYRQWLTDDLYAMPQKPKIVKPRSKRPALLKLGAGIAWLVAFIRLSPHYNTTEVLGHSYDQQSFLRKCVTLHMLGFVTRMKYYSVWTLAEGACIMSGMGFNGLDPNTGQYKWDRLQNVNPLGIELAQNTRQYLENWNQNTNRWLRHYVYLRIAPAGQKPGFGATLATFLTSAFWHGFEAGYYLTFVLAAGLQAIAKKFRRHVRPLFLAPSPDSSRIPKGLYDVASFVATQAAFSFTTVPFCVLGLSESLHVWAGVHFYVGIISILLLAFFASPLKSVLPRQAEVPVQPTQEPAFKIRDHTPLLGLPADPQALIIDAVAS